MQIALIADRCALSLARNPLTALIYNELANIMANDKNSRPVNYFEDYIHINSKMLRLMSLQIGVSGNKRDKQSQILERLPTVITNIICLMDGVFQIQWIADLWTHDKDLVMQITTSGISNITCICKGFQLANCREDLQIIFEKLAIIWNENLPRDAFSEKILNRAQKTLKFCKFYISMMLGLGICFGLPPLKNFISYNFIQKKENRTYDYSERVFLVRYPFEINTPMIYLSVLLEEQFILFFSALYWVCCDTLFAQLTTHMSLQFEILQYDVENVINKENNENQLKANVIGFIKRHQELLRLCQSIEKIFSPVLFTTMLLTSINICVNVFELQKMTSSGRYGDALLHIFHLVNIFFQLLVYCIFAEQLTQQTSSMANTIYNCKWTEKNYKFRTYFQILIMKSQKPFYCTAYGFFTIGHRRITTIVNKALSFYMMLQTTN